MSTRTSSILQRTLAAAAFALAMLPAAARADGVVIGPADLPAAERARLTAEIARARAASPAAFDAVARTRAELADIDAQKRGRIAPIGAMLKAIGPEALYALLEQIAIDAAPRGGLPDSAWTAWRAGLIEAAGMLRDPAAEPVLVAVLDSRETEPLVVRAAAEALGRIGTDQGAAKLVAMAKTAGPKRGAVLAGMGGCRRAACAEALAAAIGAHPGDDVAKAIVRALGDAGSARAWKTPIVAKSGEEAKTRAEAAEALVGAFVAYDGQVRRTASNALMVVDHPSTPALIQAKKKGASPEVAAALDELAKRFARNPTR